MPNRNSKLKKVRIIECNNCKIFITATSNSQKYCPDCSILNNKKLSSKWKKDNPDKVKEHNNKYIKNNIEKVRKIKRDYSNKNSEKRKITSQEFRINNPE